jgi:signal transduction histidine kinase
LINLLANSYKFTNSESISIEVRMIIQKNEPFAEFNVKDTGVGISKEDQAKLFTLFGMLKNTEKINTNG